MHSIEGGVTAARGFRAAGIHCGIKQDNSVPDLGVVLSDGPATAAGVFTQNRAAAAPVHLCREHLRGGAARVVLANSGNANACTGAQGRLDAMSMATAAAERFNVPVGAVCVLSTGVIGVPLPLDSILSGVARLDPVADGGAAFAHAIMTTDTHDKVAAVECSLNGRAVRIGGAAKGSGMIHPNMATLLGVLTTDAPVASDFLQHVLERAVHRSFNAISVDGDTSTNDSVLLLANGAAGGATITAGHPDAAVFERALQSVCVALATAVVRDGEGARSLIEVRVTGASSESDARIVARSISASSLVKTAVFGADPNWGRVLCAAGYAGVDFDIERATLHLGNICLFKRGVGLEYDRSTAEAYLRAPDVCFALDLGMGDDHATAWGCDLSYEYVRINGEYTT